MRSSRSLVRWALVFVIFLGLVRISLRLIVSDPHLLFNDFGVFYQAAEHVLDGQSPFTAGYSNIPNTASRWLYLPIFTVLFIPFVIFPYTVAAVLWTMLSASILFISATWLANNIFNDLTLSEKLLIGVAILMFPPILSALFNGQVTPIITALLCIYAGSIYLDDENTVVTGGTAAVAGILKPTYMPVGASLLRDYKRLIGAVIVGIILILTGLIVFGIEQHTTFIEILQDGKGWGEEAYLAPAEWRSNSTFMPWYYLFPYKLNIVANLSIVLLTIFATLRTIRDRRQETEVYVLALGLMSVPLAHPTPSIMDLSTAVPAIGVLVTAESRRSDGTPALPIFGALLITIHPFVVEFLAGHLTRGIPIVGAVAETFLPILPFLSPAVWGSFILFGLTVYRLQSRW